VDLHIPVKELASEFIDVLPSFDRRFLRSVKPFLFDPGSLTLEYLNGKRKHYLSPFKLYFMISFVFFLIGSLRDDSAERRMAVSELANDSSGTVLPKDSLFVSVAAPNSKMRFTVRDSAEVESIFGPSIVAALRKMKADPSIMFDKIKEHRPKIIFVLLPVFALLLKLLYFRSRSLYIKHLVFSFNVHSFLFFILLITDIIEMSTIPFSGYLAMPLYLCIPVNLFVGMKKVYGQSNGKTFVKFLLLSLTYSVTFLLSISIAAFIIIYLFYL
jgi:hypothetical protein